MNTDSQKDITYSVVVPVFNGEATLEELFSRTDKLFQQLGASYEMIFIDDGSRDKSWEVLKKLKAGNEKTVKAIKLSKNFGQHNAIFCGLNFISGDYVITMDDDLQNPPEEIEKLIQRHAANEADLVYGYFKRKKHEFWRNIGSKMLKNSSRKLQDAPGEGSSFKLIERHLIDKILKHHQNFVYIDELFLWYTEDIEFVEVNHHARKHNRSGYSHGKLFKLFFNVTVYYTAVPLKIMTYLGLISSIISFGFGIRFIIRKLFFDVPLGYTSIIVTILFAAGLILLSLGIIGEYLNRIYIVQNKKPPYSIKKVLK